MKKILVTYMAAMLMIFLASAAFGQYYGGMHGGMHGDGHMGYYDYPDTYGVPEYAPAPTYPYFGGYYLPQTQPYYTYPPDSYNNYYPYHHHGGYGGGC